MNLLWRTILHSWLSARRPKVGPFDVVSTPFRVLPTDLDIYRHMNNGRYLSIADIGRFDLLRRNGLYATMTRLGWYPVVASSTISYRRSLMPWQRFVVESRFLGYDERAVYLEQRFVVKGEVYARMYIRGRFLKRTGGHVSMDDLIATIGVAPHEVEVPEWLLQWGTDVALPSTRIPTPSHWE
ncbi:MULTISPECIES: thioesterase family protein [unclassified Diaminobutyricimonas]|uniref:thioesterase family protein n=1 Tax=unclassified Diaminobutyricimonas TaxID=2643261 RepID=UPI0018DF613C|nr:MULTISPECIES: thioesterase family protein [unclassified Diaminobutyricimonas]